MKFRVIGFDFEVKEDWWCCTFGEKINSNEKLTDKSQLNFITFQSGQELDFIDYIIRNRENSIFEGYNNVHFDNYCTKCVWYGINPWKVVHQCIELGKKPWEISELQYKKNVDFKTFDLFRLLGKGAPSLKDIEANLGLAIITDDTITNRKWSNLTQEEREKTIEYNKHDVFATMVLGELLQTELDAYILLIETFNLPWKTLEKKKAQIIEVICKDKIKRQPNPVEFKYKAPSFIKLYDDSVKQQMEEHTFLADKDVDKPEFSVPWDGYHYIIKRGGAHYAIKNLDLTFDGDTILVCNDFQAFYLEMMANKTNPELRYVDPILDWRVLREFVDLRLKAKAEGNKKLADALKIVINAVYGKLIEKYSPLYFWPAGLSVCLTGQLITLMICQKLKKKGLGQLIQVNTDGFYYKLHKSELEEFNSVMNEFQEKIGITFERDVITKGKLVQKDVNNYVLYNEETGKVKAKGAVVKKYNTDRVYTSYSMPIVDIAVVKYLLFKTPVNKTIFEAYDKADPKMFQIVYNMKGQNWLGCYYGDKQVQRINRGFASADKNLPMLTEMNKFGTKSKFPDKPEHVYLYNGNINNVDITKINLDIQYYINLANKGIQQYYGGK